MQDQPGNPDALRGDIDAGRTGDKVAGFDPAAAPLGTDSEAAGTPPTRGEVLQARSAERQRPDSAEKNGAQPELQPDASMRRSPQITAGAALGVAAAAVFGVLMYLAVH